MPARLAPAKVNLYLHVAPPDARGYHPLRSMVAFADIGDEVAYQHGGVGRFQIDGPFAEGLSTGDDNLVMKAIRLLEAATGETLDGFDYRLTKNLPLASGIGGGSADAGAMLRLLQPHFPDLSDDALSAIAARTGADGVMCLWSRACIAEGYGEQLCPVALPALPCVLINPGVACPTPQVFHAYDQAGTYRPIHSEWHGKSQTVTEMVAYLETTRNDLEPPAIALRPVIGDLLAALRAQPETRFARMSGSGATCFALCDTIDDASALAERLGGFWPQAWVRACRLG